LAAELEQSRENNKMTGESGSEVGLEGACILCGGASVVDDESARMIGLRAPFGIRRCATCRFRWLQPKPTEEQYEEFYRDAYYETSTSEHLGALVSTYPIPSSVIRHGAAFQPHLLRWADAQLELIERLNPSGPGRLLEIGCGTGTFLQAAQKRRWNVFGVEPNAEAAASAVAHGFDVLCATFEDCVANHSLPVEPFDCIYLAHVLEHVADPKRTVRMLLDRLSDRGLLVIEVPNQFESLASIIKRKVLRRTHPTSMFSIHHRWFFDALAIRKLLTGVDCEIISIRTAFPERISSRKTQFLHAIDRLGNLGNGRGDTIEVIARKRSLNNV
jgi:SAM-dependent methyltransferase